MGHSTEPVKTRRVYDATRRRESARRSRRTVLDAAQRLFLERGFAATTMDDVADAAGVSSKNIYKVFGNKVGLAKAVFDLAIAGDDEPVPMVERASLMKVREEPDPRRKLMLYGEHLAAVAPRHVPFQLVILDAAANDSEAAKVWNQLQAERLRGMTMFANSLATDGHLRDGVTASEARDVLWTYNSAELYRLLVNDRQWSTKRYGRWIAVALTAALLP
jgi:AcrR family transcriptional regulator